MAQETITVTYKVKEDGSLGKIAKGADKAAKATDKASKATAGHNKQQKGVAGITSNTTKGFSKMTTGMTGGLVPAYATLAANVFALTAAFGLLSRNDAVKKLEEGLEFTGRAAGRNLTLVARGLQEITDNAISAEQAMRTTAVGISAGFSQIQMEGLAEVAKGASLALGRDMADAMDRLTRGAAKLEPEILDELGIMVRLDEAVNNYAKAHSKAVTELTQFERRQAFTNAIIEDGTKKFAQLAEAMDPSSYSQLSAAFSDLAQTGIGALNSAFTPIISFFASSPMALAGLAAAFATSISGSIVGGIKGMSEASAESAARTDAQSKAATASIKPNKALTNKFNALAHAGDRSAKTLGKMDKILVKTINNSQTGDIKMKASLLMRKQITKEIHLQAMAQAKLNATTAIATLQEVGLIAGLKAHVLAMGELVVANGVAGASLGFFDAMLATTSTALAITTASVRFLGAALVTIMPYVGIAIAVLSIFGPMIMNMFKDGDTSLSKQLEENEERFKEFNKVVDQYTHSIDKAESVTEAWHKTVKPLGGMLAETATAIDAVVLAAEVDRIIAFTAATKKLTAATVKNNAAQQIMGPSGAAQSTIASSQMESAQEGIEASKELSANVARMVTEDTVRSLSSFISTSQRMTQTLKDSAGASALKVEAQAALTDAEEVATAVLKKFLEEPTVENAKAAATAMRLQAEAVNSAVNAYESFNEIIKQAKDIVGDPKKTWGVVAKELDNVAEAEKNIKAMKGGFGDTAGSQAAQKLLDTYGAARLATKAIGGISFITESYADAVTRLAKEFRELNQEFKDIADAENAFNLIKQTGIDEVGVASQAVDLIKRKIKAQADYVSKSIPNSEEEAARQKVLNDLRQDEITLILKKFDLLAGNAKDSGMGAAAEAAIRGQGAISVAKQAKEDLPENASDAEIGAADQAVSTARLEASKETLRGVATDLAAIGPEGAFMSSVIEGAMNMQLAFSTAFEVMGDKSLDMSTRVQAGLGALGSMISSLSAMSKASSDDKVRGIDDEIAAEKKRDGSSAASTAKMKSLEAKKLAVQRKAFETNKKMKMAQTVISTAMGAMAAYSSAMESIPAPFNVPVAVAMAGMVAAMGAKQLSMIASTSFQGGAGSGGGGAPSSLSIGSRSNTVDLGKGNNAGGELGYMRGESGQGTGATDFKPTPAFSGYKSKNRASGGYIVGEQGPEVFMPDTTGSIIPSGQSTGGSTNVSFNIQAMDASGVEDVLIAQKGQIIRMIREAANEHGEFFLENVREEAYQQ